ncbi:MAG: glycosyltransferase [Prevotellaceae bacterium]|nr:glycosyltransferase [Prevotellaceae bacterium]
MKYMFIIQGEGRGHLTQAISMYEMLTRNGDEVKEILVGVNELLTLPSFFREKIKCPLETFNSSCFLFSTKHKKSLFLKSILYNLWRLPDYIRSIRFIKRKIDGSGIDLVINFYEILTGLTYALMRPKTPYICIAHQYLFFHPDFAFPRKNRIQLAGLLLFTRLTCLRASRLLALSFREMRNVDNICVVPPLMRTEVLGKTPTQGDYILGYMLNAGFSEQVLNWHREHRDVFLHFFWDREDVPEELQIDDTLTFHQLNDTAFLNRMADCRAYASTGGFESICEALYLQKPVMMVPAHIEQECNAFDAVNSGAGITADKFSLLNLLEFLPSYQPNTGFIDWVGRGNFLFINNLDIADC